MHERLEAVFRCVQTGTLFRLDPVQELAYHVIDGQSAVFSVSFKLTDQIFDLGRAAVLRRFCIFWLFIAKLQTLSVKSLLSCDEESVALADKVVVVAESSFPVLLVRVSPQDVHKLAETFSECPIEVLREV